ncbi:MAG: sulfatase-like hydrolase/transferase [Candidatus Hydrogenedentes bacterium]|nr:sulfatase-like hydrolase/transferase [Candidatus Hydrogenedentota bacterium]
MSRVFFPWSIVITCATLCCAAEPRPNVLLITVDTCRANRIGCYGYGLARTPAMDAIAAEGVRCTNAITSAPITMPAHASIMTGLYPPAHGVRDNGAYALSDDAVTLAERLKEAGYDTAAFVSALVLNRRYNLSQGFDVYDDDLWAEDEPKLFMIRDRPAPKTAERVVRWLNAWSAKEQRNPFFIWVHFFDPHQPYEAQVKDRHLIPTAYDAEIAQADEGVARLVEALTARGVYDDTLTILTADHGESLGEHGEKTHAIFIYDATVHVPLLFRWPEHLPAAAVYEGPVRCVDLMPTVLAALGTSGGDRTQGADLGPPLRGEVPAPALPQYSESLLSELGFGMAPLYGVRMEGHKLIRAPKPELYDLHSDPQELRNRHADMPERVEKMNAELDRIAEESAKFATATKQNPMDQETLDMLQALGYLAGEQEREDVKGMDPKDGIALYTKMEDARHLAQSGRYADSAKLLREILEVSPRHVSARNVLALALMRQGDTSGAEREYQESLQIDPQQSRVYYMLGYLKLRAGAYDGAEKQYKRALEITPKFAEAMVHLGFIAVQRDEQDAAKNWYDQALAVDPGFPRAHLAYADLFFIKGDYARALASYKRVLEAIPGHFAALLQSGLCAQRTGDMDGARTFFTRAGELRPDSWIPPYDLACVSAVAGNRDAALSWLDKAVAKGTGGKALMQALETDTDLAALREAPAYVQLVKRARELSGE